jgi:Rab GDP dissociation inhibitor
VSTDVTRYLDFRQIAGSYVQQGSGPRATVAKVPSDAGEALRSSLMGLFEKRRAKRFLEWVGEFSEDNPSTHQGSPPLPTFWYYLTLLIANSRPEPLSLYDERRL